MVRDDCLELPQVMPIVRGESLELPKESSERSSVVHTMTFPDPYAVSDSSTTRTQEPGQEGVAEQFAGLRRLLMQNYTASLGCLEPCMDAARRLETEGQALRQENQRLRAQLAGDRALELPGNVPSERRLGEPKGNCGSCEFDRYADQDKLLTTLTTVDSSRPHEVWLPNQSGTPAPVFETTQERFEAEAAAGPRRGLRETLGSQLTMTPHSTSATSLPSVTRRRTLFCDSDAMKEKVRRRLHQPEYTVHDLYHYTGFWQKVARHEWFEVCSLVMISANSLWLAVEADHNNETLLHLSAPEFQVVEHLFCFLFSGEWSIRFMAFRQKKDCLKDHWFVFDTVLTVLMVMETWFITLMLVIAESSLKTGPVLSNLSLLRTIRLIRLIRIARMFKLLRAMPELVVLIKGMGMAYRSVLFTLVLLIIVIYVFAIAFTQLSKGTSLEETIFSSVLRSMSTLLLSGTVPDLIDTVEVTLASEGLIFAVLFFMFILMTTFTLMNLLVGVLVEVVSLTSLVEKENMDVHFVKCYFQRLVQVSDANGDLHISREEFNKLMHKPEALRALNSVGVDVYGLVDLADFIFKDKGMPLRDFMDLVLQLRGANKATVKDLVDVRKFVLHSIGVVEARLVDEIRRCPVERRRTTARGPAQEPGERP